MGLEGFRVAGAGAGITSEGLDCSFGCFIHIVRCETNRVGYRVGFEGEPWAFLDRSYPCRLFAENVNVLQGCISRSLASVKKKHFSVPIICISICANQGHLALWFWLRLSVKERAGNACTKLKAVYTSQPNISQKSWFNFSQPAHPFLSQ